MYIPHIILWSMKLQDVKRESNVSLLHWMRAMTRAHASTCSTGLNTCKKQHMQLQFVTLFVSLIFYKNSNRHSRKFMVASEYLERVTSKVCIH